MQTMESFKIEHKVRVKEFDRTLIDLVPYDDSIIGDSDETTYENYINLHGKTYPDILDSMADGIHSMKGAEEYIGEYVRKMYKAKDRSIAAVSSNIVLALLVNYYMSPVIEEKVEMEKEPDLTHTIYTPPTPEEIEERRKQREKEEAERKEKIRLEALRKKDEEKNRHFVGSLF